MSHGLWPNTHTWWCSFYMQPLWKLEYIGHMEYIPNPTHPYVPSCLAWNFFFFMVLTPRVIYSSFTPKFIESLHIWIFLYKHGWSCENFLMDLCFLCLWSELRNPSLVFGNTAVQTAFLKSSSFFYFTKKNKSKK